MLITEPLAQPQLVCRLRHVERPQQFDVDDGLESVGAQPVDRCREVSGGVIDENVESAERPQHVLDYPGHLLVTPDIADAVNGLDSVGCKAVTAA